jgi:hypothetical protein
MVFVYRPEFQVPENTMFRKLDLFPSSYEVRETHTLLSPLERVKLTHQRTKTDPVSEILCFLVLKILDDG